MGFRYRKSINAGPLRINVSKRGIGYSVGTKGYRITKRVDGRVTRTASLPGTGVSHEKTLSRAKRRTTSGSRHRPAARSRALTPEQVARNAEINAAILRGTGKTLWFAVIGWWLALILLGVALVMVIVPSTRREARGMLGTARRVAWPRSKNKGLLEIKGEKSASA